MCIFHFSAHFNQHYSLTQTFKMKNTLVPLCFGLQILFVSPG